MFKGPGNGRVGVAHNVLMPAAVLCSGAAGKVKTAPKLF